MDESRPQPGGEMGRWAFKAAFSHSAYHMLWTMKRELDVSLADVLRESIALMWKVFNHLKAGNQVILRTGEKNIELYLPRLEQREPSQVANERKAWMTPEGRFLFRWMAAAMLVGYMWGVTVATLVSVWWAAPLGAIIPVATLLLVMAGLPQLSRRVARLRGRG